MARIPARERDRLQNKEAVLGGAGHDLLFYCPCEGN
jgi:hypothetical protein